VIDLPKCGGTLESKRGCCYLYQGHRDEKEQSQLRRLQPCRVSGLGKTTGLRPSEATLRIVAEAEQHLATSGAAFQSKPRSPLPHLLVPLQSF